MLVRDLEKRGEAAAAAHPGETPKQAAAAPKSRLAALRALTLFLYILDLPSGMFAAVFGWWCGKFFFDALFVWETR